MKINKSLLPIKAHFFFFMAALGPILPQLSVYGKQLGISSIVMGSVTGILPFLFLVAKPAFGFLVDRYQQHRKSIFIALICVMSGSYALFYFVPPHSVTKLEFLGVNCSVFTPCNRTNLDEYHCKGSYPATCDSNCSEVKISNLSTMIYKSEIPQMCFLQNFTNLKDQCETSCHFYCHVDIDANRDCLYKSYSFWVFIFLMSIGTIGFNVVNSISDAICFDILGEGGQMGYGKQRVWGTVGYGVTALCAGYFVDWWSPGEEKSFTPALIVMIICTIFDVISCIKLNLPEMHQSENIIKDMIRIMKYKHVSIFVFFTVLIGIIDSLFAYYLFWYLEDIAAATGRTHDIKLLEGVSVAAGTLGAEIIFFQLSGKIMEKIGYGHSMTLCFICFALRLVLTSLIPTPWWIVPIDFIFQGPTYALSYATIVAYASAMAPPGTSATMQGVVAGMDDGFGYAIGCFIGGILFRYFNGRTVLQIFGIGSLLSGIAHHITYKTILEKEIKKEEDRKGKYKPPEEAVDQTQVAEK